MRTSIIPEAIGVARTVSAGKTRYAWRKKWRLVALNEMVTR
jgi:hypothetical protein